MQNSAASPSSQIANNNGNVLSNGSMYCSTSTLSDTGSWDTDFDDDQNSESSGFYGDVSTNVTNVEKAAPEVQTKSSGVGRVAALAKTVAASLAASGHSGSSKFPRSFKKNETPSHEAVGADSGRRSVQRPSERPLLRPPAKPLSIQTISAPFPVTGQQIQLQNDRLATKERVPSSNGINLKSSFTAGLPKPPGPESEQVQQVIGALGHLWSSDSISLSSQTQSDDDYEPVQSDSSPQLPRLSPLNDPHSTNAAPQSFLHSSPRSIIDHHTPNCSPGYSKASAQSTPFLHGSAASAATSRLSQCSKRSSGCDSVYSPCSSGSSLSDGSHHTILQVQQSVDGVYEPIEEKQKIQTHSQRSFLHSKQSAEKSESKRVTSVSSSTKSVQLDQRPPVPNRPLPPTPRPQQEKPIADAARGGLLPANLDHQPWFHNVDRKQAEELIKNGVDGYFLIRPSSQSQNPLTLTLWYNQRVYNISVRQRKDGRIALGFEKPDEQSFSSIEEMVINYQSENLLLFSRNERTGRTVLKKSPPKLSH
ncbi:B-cell linker protein-like [Thrips palmi]|uniref:B-cell linker protein-like n=1 Tax=Thrips palmi TaxID=161013 RepID=A0A6P9A9P2_THRPL|nr:B-cell linker protein-like [Thrips palmi]